MATELRQRPVEPVAADVQRIYRSLYRIRRVEEEIARVYPTDVIKSPVHLSIGQEAIAVGVAEALAQDDVVFGTYRGHAIYLAKGGDLRGMIAELYGKSSGVTHGKGGSMHLIDRAANVMGMSAVVGTTIPHALGYAYALTLRRSNAVVTSFFGDGATEEGVFFESLNFAVLKQLPVLFVCENNGYAVHSPLHTRQRNADICGRARGFGLPATRVSDGNVFSIRAAAGAAVQAIRRGDGPQFLECTTYRWKEHVGPGEDYQAGYRERDELAPWTVRDPVTNVGGRLDAATRTAIEHDVDAEISAALAFAEASPFPTPAELWTDRYA